MLSCDKIHVEMPANMRFIISILLLLGGVIISSAYTAENCPSTIPEWQRIDCYPESGSTEAGCFNRGCMWCEASVQGPPWCFFDNALPTTQNPSGGECTSCSSCLNKVDCYPEPGSSEEGCYARSCLWCPSNINGEPWCIYGDGSTPPPNAGCPSDIPESQRIDCWPGGGASEQGCVSSGCIWCESNIDGTPWCFFNTTDLPDGLPDEERVNCIPEGGFSPDKCQERNCVFANVNTADAPMCYYQNDQYGYVMNGSPVATSRGYRVMLQRLHTGSMFGGDVDVVTLDVTFDTDSSLKNLKKSSAM